MFGKRTDLAVEAKEIYHESAKEEITGVKTDVFNVNSVKVTKVVISDEHGEKVLEKPRGIYITLEADNIMFNTEQYVDICNAMAEQIRGLFEINDDTTVLIVGLGNESITPDSIGPKVISKLMITRHIKRYIPQYADERLRSVCAIAPGVLGTTGVETLELIGGAAEKLKPDLIIAVDALAARSVKRICNTFQLTDTGINPGAGVGNKRMSINKETLGVPVISIGVPTVVDAVTIANDSIEMAADGCKNAMSEIVHRYSEEERRKMISENLTDKAENLVVTPSDIDAVTEKVSKIIANGINLALHRNIDLEDIEMFTGM